VCQCLAKSQEKAISFLSQELVDDHVLVMNQQKKKNAVLSPELSALDKKLMKSDYQLTCEESS